MADYLLVPPKGQLPTAEVAFKDELYIVRGGAAGTDKLYVCRWNAGSYENVELTLTGDADLIALAALAGTGLLARTGSATYALRTLTAGSGITITNGDGVSGNPTIAVGGTGSQYRDPVYATYGGGYYLFDNNGDAIYVLRSLE